MLFESLETCRNRATQPKECVKRYSAPVVGGLFGVLAQGIANQRLQRIQVFGPPGRQYYLTPPNPLLPGTLSAVASAAVILPTTFTG